MTARPDPVPQRPASKQSVRVTVTPTDTQLMLQRVNKPLVGQLLYFSHSLADKSVSQSVSQSDKTPFNLRPSRQSALSAAATLCRMDIKQSRVAHVTFLLWSNH